VVVGHSDEPMMVVRGCIFTAVCASFWCVDNDSSYRLLYCISDET